MPIAVPSWFGFERAWLARALRAVRKDPAILQKARVEDAQYETGLGNQQVYALEHWLRAIGLVERLGDQHRITRRGQIITEYDPSIEESGTWFAIHYHLASSKDMAFAYWCASNAVQYAFDRSTLISAMRREMPGKSQATYANHLRAFLAVIRGTPIGNELRIFEVNENEVSSERYDRRLLPLPIAAYAMMDWTRQHGRSTAGTAELTQSGGPARALLLDQGMGDSVLDDIQDIYAKRVLWVSRTAGLNSVGFANDVPPLALLRAYYIEHLEAKDPVSALEAAIQTERQEGEQP